MKKAFISILVLTLCLLTACSTNGNTNESPSEAPQESAVAENNEVEKTAANNEMTEKPAEPSVAASSVTAKVYMTSEITPEGLQAVYDALGITLDADDKVGVKVSTGKLPASNYLRQDLIGDFVKRLNGTYIECNTAYGGQRASTAMHYQVAADHGFESVVLMDDVGRNRDTD